MALDGRGSSTTFSTLPAAEIFATEMPVDALCPHIVAAQVEIESKTSIQLFIALSFSSAESRRKRLP